MKRYIIKKPVIKPPRSKGIPVITLTGAPPQAKQAWWSQRFIEVLESFKMGSRLARGKAYATEAKVVKVCISSGTVTSTVLGSKKSHYRISIRLDPLSDNAWRQVMQNLSNKAIYAVELLQDKMPQDIEEAFNAANVSLFPGSLEELDSSCDCPDWSNPCKHIAATYYILAQHFDLDPFLIFVWRGRLKTQIIDALRTSWKQGKPKSLAFEAQPIKKINYDEYETYWKGNSEVTALSPLNPFSDAIPASSIEKLGEAPVQFEEKELSSILAQCYVDISEKVRDWATTEKPKKPPYRPTIY